MPIERSLYRQPKQPLQLVRSCQRLAGQNTFELCPNQLRIVHSTAISSYNRVRFAGRS
jgi:hypothetical protein